jgi:hypothetical protein
VVVVLPLAAGLVTLRNNEYGIPLVWLHRQGEASQDFTLAYTLSYRCERALMKGYVSIRTHERGTLLRLSAICVVVVHDTHIINETSPSSTVYVQAFIVSDGPKINTCDLDQCPISYNDQPRPNTVQLPTVGRCHHSRTKLARDLFPLLDTWSSPSDTAVTYPVPSSKRTQRRPMSTGTTPYPCVVGRTPHRGSSARC